MIIKILYVVANMNRGGIENMIMNHLRCIDREKIHIDFLLHREEKSHFEDEILSLGSKIFKVSRITFNGIAKYKRELELFFEQNKDYDIVHSHMNSMSYYVLYYAKKNNIPVRIAHSHIAKRYPGLKGILKEIMKYRLRRVYSHGFACGEDAGKYLFGRKSKNVYILNNAIDAKKFSYNHLQREQVRKQLNIEKSLVIGHIARFTYQKNQLFLIDVFSEIIKFKSDSVLLLVGDGEEKYNIKKRVKTLNLEDKVIFMGIQEETSKFYNAMDVFFLPSLFEGLPVVMIEAQASGLNVVASNKIDKKSKITDLVEFVSLDKEAKYWANLILTKKYSNRKDTYNSIVMNNYDILDNCKRLEKKYEDLIEYENTQFK